MTNSQEGFFGERAASVYDESVAGMFEPGAVAPVVELLAELARDGAALELGIGTGRIALPLAERGVRVHGIDNSEAMVARLRAKPGGGRSTSRSATSLQPVSAGSSRSSTSCSTRSSTW